MGPGKSAKYHATYCRCRHCEARRYAKEVMRAVDLAKENGRRKELEFWNSKVKAEPAPVRREYYVTRQVNEFRYEVYWVESLEVEVFMGWRNTQSEASAFVTLLEKADLEYAKDLQVAEKAWEEMQLRGTQRMTGQYASVADMPLSAVWRFFFPKNTRGRLDLSGVVELGVAGVLFLFGYAVGALVAIIIALCFFMAAGFASKK